MYLYIEENLTQKRTKNGNKVNKKLLWSKVPYHHFMHAAVVHVEINESQSTNIVMISPPLGGNDSNIEECRENGYAKR